jgi:hypothetical protein
MCCNFSAGIVIYKGKLKLLKFTLSFPKLSQKLISRQYNEKAEFIDEQTFSQDTLTQ